MKCPRCESSALDERERDGVTIDVCRACRGIWLDRGELEKILARATKEIDAYESGAPRRERDSDPPDSSRRGWQDGRAQGTHPHRKRRWYESLGDVFD